MEIQIKPNKTYKTKLTQTKPTFKVPKISWSKTKFCRKTLVGKNFGQKIVLVLGIFLVQKNIFGPKKIVVPKKIWTKTIVLPNWSLALKTKSCLRI